MRHLILLLALGIAGLVSAEEAPCTTHSDGKYYDLNPLKGKKDAELKTPGGQTLSINVCQTITTETFGLKEDIKADEVGGVVRKAHGHFSIGKVNTTLAVVDSKPRLVLSGGSQCKATLEGSALDLRASTIVEFVCDTSIFGPGQPRLLGQLPPGDDELGCAYFIEWKTHFACPTSENSGVWGFFAVIAVLALILLMTYTVLGTLYNRYVLQLRGFDQIPQFSLESMRYHAREAMDWLKDISATYNLGGTGGGLPYASRNSMATNPVSHHTQTNEDPNTDASNNFVRPQSSTRRPSHQNTNPVSHHTQAQRELQEPQTSSGSPPPPPPKQSLSQFIPRRVDLGSHVPTKEEREFMLGEDNEEDGEELQDQSTSAAPAAPSAPMNVGSPTTDTPSVLNRGDAKISAIRGRDTDGGPIRL